MLEKSEKKPNPFRRDTIVTFKVHKSEKQALDALAKRHKLSVSDLIRALIAEKLRKEKTV